jgi:hypothetical protein
VALTVTLLGSAFTSNAGNKTVTAIPTAGDIIVIIAAATGPTGATVSVSDNNADGHGNYASIVTSLKNASADPMFAFVRADPVRSATSTVFTSVQTGSSGGGLLVYRIAGSTLTGPAFIRQSGAQSNHASGAAPATPLGVGAALTGNALIAAVFDATGGAPGLTVPTGWVAADFNAGYTIPSAGLIATHINSGFTGSTVTWNTSDATAFCSIAFEMSAAQGNLAISPEIPPAKVQQAVSRGAYFCLGEKWARRGRLWVPVPGRPYALA